MKRRRFLALGARATAIGAFYASVPGTSWAQDAAPEDPPLDGAAADGDDSVQLPADAAPPLERAAGLNAVEVRLGMSADFSGRTARTSVNALRGALAWLNEINALGGIEGRRLTLLAQDDGGDPRRAVHNARALIEQHEVFCLFNGLGTATLGSLLPVLYGHRADDLWMLGELSGAEVTRSAPYAAQFFPVRASHRREMSALVDAMADDGAKKFGLLYPITPHGRSGADAAQRAMAEAGHRYLAEATWRYGPDQDRHLKAAAKHLKDSGADAVIIAGGGEVAARFVNEAFNSGWRPAIGIGAVPDADGWYDQLTTLGDSARVWTTRPVPLADTPGLPALEELRRLVARWRPKPPAGLTSESFDESRLSTAMIEGFLHARLLTAGLRLAGPWPTRRSVREALESLRGYDLGIGAPVNYPADGDRGLARVFLARWRGGRFRAPSDPSADAAGPDGALAPDAAGDPAETLENLDANADGAADGDTSPDLIESASPDGPQSQA